MTSAQVVVCRGCGCALSRPVVLLPSLPDRVPNWANDGVGFEPTVATGTCAVDDQPRARREPGGDPVGTSGCLVLHPDDAHDLERHPSRSRRNGCCGNDGFGGPNRRCPRCHAEVATLVDDCWTAVELRFEPSAVQVSDDGPRPT